MIEFMLIRFKKAQKKYYEIAKQELLCKQKKTHWIWFIFPQLKGLGTSDMSNYYGIRGIKEAKRYYKDKYLRNHLNELTKILFYYNDNELLNALGDIDYIKVRSCMTLFYLATNEKRFKMVIDKCYNGIMCNETIHLLYSK